MRIIDRIFGRKPASESRASLENPAVNISDRNVLAMFNINAAVSSIVVTTDLAMTVPAVACAVNFLGGTMAGLPLKVYKKTKTGRDEVKGGLANLLHRAVNPGCSSYEWRKYSYDQELTEGRQYTFIERNTARRITNLWPLDPSLVTPFRRNGVKQYRYVENGQTFTYDAAEIIDIPFMLKRDMISHRSPIKMAERQIAIAVAIDRYGSAFFANGGVPALQMIGQMESPAAVRRASEDVSLAVKQANREGNNVLAMPANHELKPIATDPEKMQMEKAQRFLIEQFARVWNLPPAFLQDLTHGTFSNTEQQDLQFVKHSLRRHVEQGEQEMNLKLFGAGPSNIYVEYNIDGLLRGDFKTRMEGYATAIQNAIKKPNEIRALENSPADPSGNNLMIQGGTVPLGTQPLPAKDGAIEDGE